MPSIVSDTSPLRALVGLGRLDLLEAIFQEVIIPPAVLDELNRADSRLPSVTQARLGFVRVMTPTDTAVVLDRWSKLHRGETEALALAVELGADAILMHETEGRNVAQSLGLRPLGVLGILLMAKERGLLPEIAPLVDQLQRNIGFFISRSLRSQVLALAAEAPS